MMDRFKECVEESTALGTEGPDQLTSMASPQVL